MFSVFPHNHNLTLFGQPELLSNLNLGAHEDIRSRITYSVLCPRLGTDEMVLFIYGQLNRCGWPHSTFSQDAIGLLVRTEDGLMRKARNMALTFLLVAVRARKRLIEVDIVNRLLMQPHWRDERDIDARLPN